MEITRLRSPLYAQIELTFACNLACSHCYNEPRFSNDNGLVKLRVVKKEKTEAETKEALNEVIAEIEIIQKSKKENEEARIYRDFKALKTAWLEAIKSIPNNGEYYFFSVGYGEDPYLKRFFESIASELKKRNIKVNGIANIKEKGLYENYYKKIGYNMKYTNLTWPSDLSVIGNFILLFVWDKKEPVVYSIESKTLVNSYLEFLKNIWNSQEAKI